MYRKLFSLLILIFPFNFSIAQGKPDTAFVLSAINHAKKTYVRGLGGHSHLHNGVEHKHYRDEVELEAYLEPDWIDGSIFYDQELFKNVPLMYDMIAQRVLTYFYGQADIELITDKVDWFMINRRKFVYLGRGKKDDVIDPAFYELLDDGYVKLYARRRKRIDEKIGENKVMYSVSGTNHFFLYKDGKYIPVKGKGALVAALNDKKKELKQFKRENKIQFNNENRETAIKQYVARYNELSLR
jgi:hypothetical protein